LSLPGNPSWLRDLERELATDHEGEALAVSLVVLASVAGREIALAHDEARGAGRRGALLLAAGGDPERGLDLNGRAVAAVAEDLRTVDRQLALEQGIQDLKAQAAGLPSVLEALTGLQGAPDIAWRAYAAAVLAEQLGAAD
jgi:hypothetical protein